MAGEEGADATPQGFQDLLLGLSQGNYDRKARAYEDMMLRGLTYQSPEQAAGLLQPFLGKIEAPWLDLGAGTGLFARALRDKGLTSPGIALDANEAMMGLAAETGLYTGGVLADAVRALPFRRGALKAVLALGLLEHVGWLEGFFEGLAWVIRPGGLLAFSFVPHAGPEPMDLDVHSNTMKHLPPLLLHEVKRTGFETAAVHEYPAYRNKDDWHSHQLVLAYRGVGRR